jgi:dihydrodipicolinate synthase/N-acetylneuraminate lyase
MKKNKSKSPLTGIIPPLITPLMDRDKLDVAGLERLVEHVLAGGVSGLFVLGTTGEGPSLSYRLRRELVKRVCRQVKNRVPVLVAITDTAFVESVTVARQAADAGADAVVAAPPYYMPEAQPELQEYLDHLVPELPLPLYLYNMPSLTKVSYELDVVRWALDNPRIIGLKDSSGDLDYFKRAAGHRQGPSRLDAADRAGGKIMEALELGGTAASAAAPILFPKLYTACARRIAPGDLARARALQQQIQRVSDALYHIGKHSSTIIKGIKCALACLGICDDFMAEPFHRFRA